MMKICTKCKISKNLNNFFKDKTTKDGYYPWCKICKQKYSKSSHHLALRRNYYKKNFLKERERCRKKAIKLKEYYHSWILLHKKYTQAYQKTHYALRIGKLQKQSCENCGRLKVQAHHEDYSKPLDVIWLCKKCHYGYHVQKRELLLIPTP